LVAGIDFDHLHHAQILMVHHVAVEHEFAGEIEEARSEGDAAIAREDRLVQPNRLLKRNTVDFGQQHIVDMDVEDVIVRGLVDHRPFLHGAEANALIDPVGIEDRAVDREPELLPCVPGSIVRNVSTRVPMIS
jgi:hypothetical protein